MPIKIGFYLLDAYKSTHTGAIIYMKTWNRPARNLAIANWANVLPVIKIIKDIICKIKLETITFLVDKRPKQGTAINEPITPPAYTKDPSVPSYIFVRGILLFNYNPIAGITPCPILTKNEVINSNVKVYFLFLGYY